ncbi:hypothetical protein cypCar_00008734 [Cyprinus carpio]|nr:hypothetical protein cypCar_00008734 [Cyprinus carpio]
MNGAAFPSPTAEMAEMNRIHYQLEYTEGISQRMRIPEQLKVASYNHDEQEISEHETLHTAMMHVPERIVVAGDRNEMQFPRDLDLIQSTQMESTLSLKTPPRVLTLSERPIDFLEMEQPSSASQTSEEVRMQTRTRRERSVSENTSVHHNGQLARNDSICLSVYVFFCPFLLSLSSYPLLSQPSLRGGSTLSNPQHDSR